ncbi:MAG: hypothetical protein MJ116_11425 [Lachnospiraceae bacterium]|nr:hypothetical protein [Lachnospiraceae bacterium]
MKKKRPKRKSSDVSRRRRNIILEMIGTVLIAGALFWGLFFVNSIEVVGNSGKNYTDLEIVEMSLPEFWTKNSVLLRVFRRRVDLKDVRFMESVEVEFKSRNAIRLHVNEKKPVGFVRLNDRDFYFDHEGVVLEIMSAEETAQLKAQAMESADITAEPEEIPETETASDAEPETEAEAVSVEAVEEFNPNLADVPMISGLNVTEVAAGQRLPLSNPTFFNTIQFLTKMIDKYGIQPDYVEITENAKGVREMTLYYGTVRAALGTDSDLEEKVTRLAAILPKLGGRSGILHLEEFTSDTINIVFDADQ